MPFDIVQSVKLEVVIPKLVVCEFCHTEYVYEMKCSQEASASILKYGEARAEKEALTTAEQRLIEHIREGCEPVPCPRCFYYQKHMSELLGKQQYSWMMIIFVPLLLLGGLALPMVLFAEETQTRISAACAIAGSIAGFVVLMMAYKLLSKLYDGNKLPESSRKSIAGERAFLMDDFRQHRTKQTVAEYQLHLRKSEEVGNAQPFVVDIWLKDEELATGEPVVVCLPSGDMSELDIDESLETGSIYPLESTSGEPIPFLARVCVFNRTPIAL